MLQALQLGDVAAHLLLVGDGAGGGGAHLHQRLLHFEDDHADHLRRIFRPVEQVGDIGGDDVAGAGENTRSEEHTSELKSLMRISYAVFCLKKKNEISHM